jgi:hypothetical protein
MAWRPKVNRHIQIFVQKTVGGNAQFQKIRPGVITALGGGNLVTARVRHIGETYVNIDERQDPNEDLVAVKYIPY